MEVNLELFMPVGRLIVQFDETFIERIESDDSKIKAWIGPSISARIMKLGERFMNYLSKRY